MAKMSDKVSTNDQVKPGTTAAPAEGGNASVQEEELPVKAQLTPQQIEDLRAKAAKAEEHWDRLLRTTAELENFKRRAAKERDDLRKYATEDLIERLVPVLDSFGMALEAASTATSVEALKTGIAMIHSQLRSVLTEAGLEEIDALGKAFDPKWHEALLHQESAEVAEGHVLQQLRKGYKLRERLLRPASVIVAKQPGS